jgi:hypothetical protein
LLNTVDFFSKLQVSQAAQGMGLETEEVTYVLEKQVTYGVSLIQQEFLIFGRGRE